jgi:hypothetical protein
MRNDKIKDALTPAAIRADYIQRGFIKPGAFKVVSVKCKTCTSSFERLPEWTVNQTCPACSVRRKDSN